LIIRRLPSDFVVEEALNAGFAAGLVPAPSGGRGEAVYVLEKISLTTPEAVHGLAAAAGVRAGQVGYAGLKDKHAQTRQHVSLPLRASTPELVPRTLSGKGWSAELVGWANRAIAADDIARNRFTIVVRDATAAEFSAMERRAEKLMIAAPGSGDGSLPIVNYFGDQRFGSARHGKGFAATHLIRGDFEGALRLLIGTPARKDSGKRRDLTRAAAQHWGQWAEVLIKTPRCPERRAVEVLAAGGSFKDAFAALPNLTQVMSVEAFQSWLWNATARGMVEMLAGEKLRAEDDFGEMVFPVAAEVPAAWMACQVPMLSAATRAEGAWAESAHRVLEEIGIGVESLKIPGLRRPAFGEAMRPLMVRAERFAISPAEPDELGRGGRLKRTVRFELPRGAYATVVLRALGQ
jgi:tRNA pseudouridine13 synthase